MKTMQAVPIHTYGGPEVLKYEEVPRPQPETGEALIRVHAAGMNSVDWKVRESYLKVTPPKGAPEEMQSTGAPSRRADGD